MNVPNIITSSPSGGRFDFDDGGTYCGGWQDGKAHGHGVCTGPKNAGEYSGSWNFGFEMSGVYKWTNGAVYEGRWQNGKRHGVGVEYNGKWIYKGEWSQGLKGRYGVKASSNSAVKYEGTWANGLQDGYGSETYSDGGYYQGQMCRGLRHGYGVRKSAPYGDSQLNNPSKNGPLTGSGLPSSKLLLHANSIQSTGSAADLLITDDDSPKPEDGFKPNIDRTLVSKNGFVLVAKPLDVPMPASSSSSGGGGRLSPDVGGGVASALRRNSLTNRLLPNSNRIPSKNTATSSILRGLGLRKQKSTSDLDAAGSGAGRYGANKGSHSNNGGQTNSSQLDGSQTDMPLVPFTLSPEELDITDPATVETYMGEWKHDKRNGHGVCDRSDGLKYEGQWHNDMKCGYGVTTFKDGTKEEGKYKNNILIVDSKVKRFFQLGGSTIRQRIDEAVKLAQQAQSMALKKAEIAESRAATARDKADQAMTAAIEADRDSQIAYSVARQYSDSQQQMALQQQQQMQAFNGQHMGSQAPPAMMAMSSGNQMMMVPTANVFQHQQQQQQQAFNQFSTFNQPDNPNLQNQGQIPNLNMATSPLQMRRVSQYQRQQQQQQQTFNNQHQKDHNYQQQQHPNIINMNDQQQHHTQQQQQQQFLGLIEPFNGRRGSFRGGSQPPQGASSGAGSASRYHNHHHRHPPVGRQSSDPFSDLFDQYKSSGGGPSGQSASSVSGAGGRLLRRGLSKQTSLDYTQLRSSVPRGLGANYDQQNSGAQQQAGSMSRQSLMRRYRMSSLDNGNYNLEQESAGIDMQQQLKHLVTSGEDLQQQQHQMHSAGNSQINGMQHAQPSAIGDTLAAPTPTTGSSYLEAPQSSAAGSSSINTPSPLESTFTGVSSRQVQPASLSSVGVGGGKRQQTALNQQQHSNDATNHQMSGVLNRNRNNFVNQPAHQYRQRDVHSLADEQLYLADRRRSHLIMMQDILGKTEYSNYDFTITQAPRPSQRCMRRTASLNRPTPTRPLSTGSQRAGGDVALGSQLDFLRSTSLSQNMLAFNAHNQQSRSGSSNPTPGQQQADRHANWLASRQANSSLDPSADLQFHATHTDHNNPNLLKPQQQQHDQQQIANSSSHLTLADHDNSGQMLNRKPSLQVRYDLYQLGGLMSREEVARLSHAQREQKRLEFELAEKRAKQPLLHLYLSLKEFITNHQLVISVFFINLGLFKMFVDLIA